VTPTADWTKHNSRHRWSPEEIELLRNTYPKGGLAGVRDALQKMFPYGPKRSDSAIYAKAWELELTQKRRHE
jgi:hypothetical protein